MELPDTAEPTKDPQLVPDVVSVTPSTDPATTWPDLHRAAALPTDMLPALATLLAATRVPAAPHTQTATDTLVDTEAPGEHLAL
jgi:hypothetical protein